MGFIGDIIEFFFSNFIDLLVPDGCGRACGCIVFIVLATLFCGFGLGILATQ